MSRSITVFGAGTLLLFSTPVLAAELTGGRINLEYSQLTEKVGGETLNKTSLDTATEIGFTKSAAMQVDLGTYKYGATNLDGHNVALHGIFHMNETTSFGAYIGQDGLESSDANFAGLEFGIEGQSIEFEAYYLADTDNSGDNNVFGLHANYDFTSNFAVTGEVMSGNFGAADVTNYSVGVRYSATPSFALTADIGAMDTEALGVSGNDTFVAVGAEYTFGAARGATFGKRSLLSVIPGF